MKWGRQAYKYWDKDNPDRMNATNVQRPWKENVSRNEFSHDFPLQTYHDLRVIICLGGCSATYSEQEDKKEMRIVVRAND